MRQAISEIDSRDNACTTALGAWQAVWIQTHRPDAACRGPVEVFRVLAAEGAAPAFLHSGEGAGGRFSMIALDEESRLRIDQTEPGDPFQRLQAAIDGAPRHTGPRPDIPFIGGWLGFFSYDLLHHVERIATRAAADHTFPLIELGFFRTVLCYDHASQRWTACRLIRGGQSSESATSEVSRLLDRLSTAPLPPQKPSPPLRCRLCSNFTRQQYEAAVARTLEYIAAGDIYQVNIAQRFEGRLQAPPHLLAQRLFDASPAPFSAFLPLGDRAIVSSSPERFLMVRDRTVETWPIKGTRPRGATPEQDARLLRELLASEKETAELTMITDLLRNDIGRVCSYGSVNVASHRAVASFRNVHHTYSRVMGRLRRDTTVSDLIRATFPGGSVTGAPKVRAMEIIEEIEPTSRGPYCGAIGYIGVDGSIDLSIVIRTILCEGDRITFQVGGGIVADSLPALEYDETLHKARGMMRALDQ